MKEKKYNAYKIALIGVAILITIIIIFASIIYLFFADTELNGEKINGNNIFVRLIIISLMVYADYRLIRFIIKD